jgi:hypothetical protein
MDTTVPENAGGRVLEVFSISIGLDLRDPQAYVKSFKDCWLVLRCHFLQRNQRLVSTLQNLSLDSLDYPKVSIFVEILIETLISTFQKPTSRQSRNLDWSRLTRPPGLCNIIQRLLTGVASSLFAKKSKILIFPRANTIALGPRQTDSINQMIPLTNTHISLLRTNRPWIPEKNWTL